MALKDETTLVPSIQSPGSPSRAARKPRRAEEHPRLTRKALRRTPHLVGIGGQQEVEVRASVLHLPLDLRAATVSVVGVQGL